MSTLYKKIIKSDIKEIKSILEELTSAMAQNLDANEVIKFRLILSELLFNAHKHGNNKDQNKEIGIEISSDDNERYYISVNDQGKGIESNLINKKIEDVKKRKAFYEKHGRGLMLVIGLSEELQINDTGKKICAIVKLR